METFEERKKNLKKWLPGWIEEQMKYAREEMDEWMNHGSWIHQEGQIISIRHAYELHLNLTDSEIIERITTRDKDERVDIATNFKCDPIDLFDKIEQILSNKEKMNEIIEWLADDSPYNESWWHVIGDNPFQSNGFKWNKTERKVDRITDALDIFEIRLEKEKNGNAFYIATVYPSM